MNLDPVIVDEFPLFKLTLPRPPQLLEALGYFGGNRTIGLWNDDFKTTVSDGYRTITAANPGWKSYCNHPKISCYMAQLDATYDVHGDEYGVNRANYGFVVKENSLYLADVKNITKLLKKNKDYRPDWIRNATQEQVLDPSWMMKHADWSTRMMATFPKYNTQCHQATGEMLDWLNAVMQGDR